jgi:hypothetical protein
MRKSVKRALGLTALAGLGYAAWRSYAKRGADAVAPGLKWEPRPFPYPPQPVQTTRPEGDPVIADPVDAVPAWAQPNGDGACPVGYPVKAKVASGIFHVEGGRNYARTKPDRCYATPQAAEADGLRASKT